MTSRPPIPPVSITYASNRRATIPSTLLSPIHSDEEEDPLKLLQLTTHPKPSKSEKRKRAINDPFEDEMNEWSQDLKRRLGDDFDCEARSVIEGCPQGMCFIPLRKEKLLEQTSMENVVLQDSRSRR